jgi:hypothetical protein
MENAQVYIVRSDKDTHFTGAIVTDAGEAESITGLPAYKCVIEALNIISKENLAWEVELYTKNTHDDAADMDNDSYIGSVRFTAGDGKTDGTYYKYSTANSVVNFRGVPYVDEDGEGSQELHAILRNRSAASKSAGAAGEAVISVQVRPDINSGM